MGTLTLLDACAVIAFLTDEPAASEVEALLAHPARPVAITAVNLAESADRLIRGGTGEPETLLRRLDTLLAHSLPVRPVDAPVGRRAGQLRASAYHRRHTPLSMADCVLAAAAETDNAAVATSDPPLAALVRSLGLDVVALPDRAGRPP